MVYPMQDDILVAYIFQVGFHNPLIAVPKRVGCFHHDN